MDIVQRIARGPLSVRANLKYFDEINLEMKTVPCAKRGAFKDKIFKFLS